MKKLCGSLVISWYDIFFTFKSQTFRHREDKAQHNVFRYPITKLLVNIQKRSGKFTSRAAATIEKGSNLEPTILRFRVCFLVQSSNPAKL